MRVRIVKSGYDSYWYSNRIGEEFEVREYSSTDYDLVEDWKKCIRKDDCIIISNEDEMKNYIVIEGKKIKLSEETIRTIKKSLIVEKLEWIPKMGERYWYISDSGMIIQKVWYSDYEDKYRLKTGNIFKTYEIAEQKLADMNDEIQQTFVKIENYVRNNGEDWKADFNNRSQDKYWFRYDYEEDVWRTHTGQPTVNYGGICVHKQMADKVLKMLKGGVYNG